MIWTDEEKRLLEHGRRLGPEVETSRDRLLLSIASSSPVFLAAASVKAAVALEAKLALVAVGQVGVAGLAKATLIGGAAGVAVAVGSGTVATDSSTVESATVTVQQERVVVDAGSAESHGARIENLGAPAHQSNAPQLASDGPNAFKQPSRPHHPADRTAVGKHAVSAADGAHPKRVGDAPENIGSDSPAPASASAPASAASAALASLDAARRALAVGDVVSAQRALTKYAAVRGDGMLDPEAALLRLRTLVDSGQGAAAAELAGRWLAANPQTPYAEALRRIAGASKTKETSP